MEGAILGVRVATLTHTQATIERTGLTKSREKWSMEPSMELVSFLNRTRTDLGPFQHTVPLVPIFLLALQSIQAFNANVSGDLQKREPNLATRSGFDLLAPSSAGQAAS